MTLATSSGWTKACKRCKTPQPQEGICSPAALPKPITQYGQDYASNEYSNVYGRAFGEYATRYNQFETNQANKFNRLSSLAGGGQMAANQLNANLGQTAGNVSNIYATEGQQVGNSLLAGGSARASGYAGIANAATGFSNNMLDYYFLNQLKGKG
jgi:hypothetical protein